MAKEKNIFEAASNKLGKKKKDLHKSPAAPKPSPLEFKRIEDPEINEMRNKIRQMKQEIQDKLDIINKHSGLTHQQVHELINNPKNFSTAQWNELQEYRKKLGEKIYNAIGSNRVVLEPKEESNIAQTPKPKDTTAASRKGKTLGARKKWIPM